MRAPVLFVLSCDAKFFEFAQGAILSLRRALPADEQAQIGFLDCGCTAQQRTWLGQHVEHLKPAAWPIDFPGRDHAPEYLKAKVVRPYLRQRFPGFEVYVWLDADTWVQDGQALALFLQGARRRGLAIVPEIDRGQVAIQYGGMPGRWDVYYRAYRNGFGEAVARKLHNYPMLNSGVFAIHHDAPHWSAYEECLRAALQRLNGIFAEAVLLDQPALNVAVYQHFFSQTEMLPLWCNWTCHTGLPAWDRQKQRLVEPYLPHVPIGIVHFTDKPKVEIAQLRTTDGEKVWVRLRYPAQQLPPEETAALKDLPPPTLVTPVSPPSIPLQGILTRAEQLFRIGRLEEVPALCRLVIDEAPSLPDPHRYLGLAAYARGRFAEAVEHLKRALTLAPDDAVGHDNLSLVLLALRQPVEAEAAARRALALYPALATAWHNLGLALAAQGRPGDAEAALRQSLQRQPSNPDVWNNLAAVLEQQQRLPDAVAALERALQVHPGHPLAQDNLQRLRRLPVRNA